MALCVIECVRVCVRACVRARAWWRCQATAAAPLRALVTRAQSLSGSRACNAGIALMFSAFLLARLFVCGSRRNQLNRHRQSTGAVRRRPLCAPPRASKPRRAACGRAGRRSGRRGQLRPAAERRTPVVDRPSRQSSSQRTNRREPLLRRAPRRPATRRGAGARSGTGAPGVHQLDFQCRRHGLCAASVRQAAAVLGRRIWRRGSALRPPLSPPPARCPRPPAAAPRASCTA